MPPAAQLREHRLLQASATNMPGVAGKSQAQARLLIWMWCLVGRLSRDPVKRPSLSDKKDKKKKKKRSGLPARPAPRDYARMHALVP